MKKAFFLVMTVIASVLLLVGATVWEGVTDVVSAGDLPGGSFSIATNSFPRNTIVDITNLENGKMVRVKVVSGLEATGLLATLSRNAADSIDLRGNSTCRIRMTQPSDDIAFSHYRLGPITPPAPAVTELDAPAENGISGADTPPADDTALANNAAAAGSTPTAGDSTVTNNATVAGNLLKAGDSSVTNNAAATGNVPVARDSAVTNNVAATGNLLKAGDLPVTDNATVADNIPSARDSTTTAGNVAAEDDSTTERAAAVTPAGNPPETGGSVEPGIASGKLSLLPAEERPPEDTKRVIASDGAAYKPVETEETNTAYIPPSEFSPFPVPLISSLEPDKWYVQVGVYTHPEYVEDEIHRIGTAYPLAIQNVGTDTSPLFRVLLGPLNQGESGAMLQRFKSIGYTDAFVRHN